MPPPTPLSLLLLLLTTTNALLYPTTTINIGTKAQPTPSLSPWHIQLTYPTTSSATPNTSSFLPTYVFVSGFAGQYDIHQYTQVLAEIASHGCIVIGVDRPFKLQPIINYTDLALSLDTVINFYHTNLTHVLTTTTANHSAGLPDLKQLYVGGHSAGNHVIVRRLTNFSTQTQAKGVIMLDPVDGEDPFGFVKEFVIHPPQKVTFTLPALLIETGLDPQGHPPCAPLLMSNDRFYNAWRGAIWSMNFTQVGHMDLTNDGGSLSKIVCPSSKNKTIEPVYRRWLGNAVHAFLQQDVAVLEGLTKATGLHVLYKHKNTDQRLPFSTAPAPAPAPASATNEQCQDARTQVECTKIQDCQYCSYPGYCTLIGPPCPTRPEPYPINGYFYSPTTFEVFQLTSVNNKTVHATNLNGSWNPMQISRSTNILTAQFSNENKTNFGNAERVPNVGYRIFWQVYVDTWNNGSLPPEKPGYFPIEFQRQLFHTQSPTQGKFLVMTVTTQTNGSYLFHSLNNSFPNTTSKNVMSSGNRQLIKVQFQKNVVSSGTVECDNALKATECKAQAEFQFKRLGSLEIPIVWRAGGVPPPPPPPPIEHCSGYFAEKPCLNATFSPSGRTCAWCVSNDKVDALCFPTRNEPDQKAWTCEREIWRV